MKRRVFAMLLVLVLVLSCLPAQVFGVAATVIESGSCGDELTWTFDSDGVLTISGTGSMNSYSAYGSPWYWYVGEITKIVVEEGVTTIGSAAFHGCYKVTEVVLPNTVTRLEDRVFYDCSSLRSIDLPDALTFIGWSAFFCCSLLEEIEFPQTLETIEYGAFTSCTSLKEVTIPAGVTVIEERPFSYCSSLTGIWVDENNANYYSDNSGALLDKVNKILVQIPGALKGSYTVPEEVTQIGDIAAGGCTGLTSLSFPDGLQKIGVSAFRDCTGLRSVILPPALTEVDTSAFENCTRLQGVVFQGDAPSISYNAFGSTSAQGYYPADNATWTEKQISIIGNYIALQPIVDLIILAQPENVQSVPNQRLSVSVDVYGTDLSYEWWVGAAGSDVFGKTDFTGNTYSITLNSYTVGLQVYCVVTDGSGNQLQSDVATFSYVEAIVENTQLGPIINTEGETLYYSFVPTYSCYYQLVSDGQRAVIIELYDEYMNLLVSNEGTTDTSVTCDFFEGCVYFITLRYADAKNRGPFDFSVNHVNSCYSSNTTVEATCQSNGQRTNCCDLCGYTWSEEFTGTHNYVDGFCATCGEEKLPSGPCGDNLTWTLDHEGVLTISGSGAMYDYSLYQFAPWYEHIDFISRLAIDDGVTSIGACAFYNCVGLTSVDIPDGVISIGEYAFNGCSTLYSVNFGADVSDIGENAFWNCSSLTYVTLPDNMTTIENSLFGNCTNLAYVIIPEGVTTIGESAFTGCEALKSVNIPDTVTTIGDSAFYACTALETVQIPDNVTGIGNRAFAECTALTEAQLGESVATIGEYAFRYCSSLKSINIPAAVSTVGERAFDQCPALTDIYIEDLVAWMNISYGSQFSRPLQANENSKNLYLNGTLLTDAVIPDGVTEICDYAFYACGNLKSVSLPASLTRIGDSAFAGCTALAAVDIPKSVTSIGYSAFNQCSGLTSIVIPEGVTEIYNATFSYCTGLTSVTIPSTVTAIGIDAFGHCIGLQSITIPDRVATISDFAFWCCSGLKTVTFLGDAPAIDDIAFSNVEATMYYPAGNSTWTTEVLQNYGGTLTWAQQSEAVVIPTLSLVAPSLNFEDEIYYNVYYTASDMTSVVEMGLITFNSYLPEGTINDAAEVIPGYTVSGSNYMSHTNGISAMLLGDALYFRVYAKLSDGTYAYSATAGYHAVAYAKDILANSSNEKMKALVVAMLNYGAAAQVHFNHNTDNLMNAFLTEEQQALVSDYSADMVEGLAAVDKTKVGAFAGVSGGYSALAPNVAFEGAFAINFYFTPAKAMDGQLKLYYWKLDDYNAADVLTADNATGVVVMEETSVAGQYLGAVTEIAAKQIDQTVYVCGVYESDGVSYPTGVSIVSFGMLFDFAFAS